MAIAQEIKKQEQDMLGGALFYFASFGAASAVAFFAAFLLQAISRTTGAGISVSSASWIFLFLFPGALSLATFFVARAIGGKSVRPLYGIIAGYGTYSALSFLIMIFSSQIEPMNWFVLILTLTALAVFSAETISQKVKTLFPQTERKTTEAVSTVKQKEPDETKSDISKPEKSNPTLLISPHNTESKSKDE